MKKIFCIMVILVLLMVTGCKNTNEESEVLAKVPEESYVISTGNIKEGNIQIEYPIIEKYDDEKLQDKWNERIYDEIEKRIANLGENDTFNMKYSVISQSEKMVSILMEGYEYYEGAAYPHSFKYTYNISFESDTNIRLAEKYDTLEIAKYLLSGMNYTVVGVSKEEFVDYLKSAFENEMALQEVLNQFDFNYGDEMEVYGYSYYRKRSLELCVEVPHALGDCVEVSFPYENITEISEE